MNNYQIPPQLIQLMRSGGNPQSILTNMLKNNNSPMAQNIINMMNVNDSKGIETFARTICKSKGIDVDNMMNQIKQNFQ